MDRKEYTGIGYGIAKQMRYEEPLILPIAQEVAVALALEFARNHPDFASNYGKFMTDQLDNFYITVMA